MAEKVIVYWRDMPAQVIVKAGRRTAKRQLPERFEQAIDRAAMRAGLPARTPISSSGGGRRPVPCGDDLEAEADAEVALLERGYPPERLRELVAQAAGAGEGEAHVRRPALVGAPLRAPGRLLSAVRAGAARGRPAPAPHRLRAAGSAHGPGRARG